jgi:Arginyl tRNA synthetase N terminal domain
VKQIHDALEEYLKNEKITDVKVEVRDNKDKENGDFYTNLSFKLSKTLKRNPYDIATSINKYISPKINKYYKTVVSDNGYINFYETSNNYKYTLKEIQKMDIEFNIKNVDLTNNNKEIIYIYTRLENIINVLKLEKIYVDIEKLNIDNMSKQLKAILDKSINIYEKIKYNRDIYPLIEGLNEISKMILNYEQVNIIRYLDKDELYNFIVISNTINTLIKNALINLSND